MYTQGDFDGFDYKGKEIIVMVVSKYKCSLQFSLDYLEQAYSDLDYIGGEGDAILKK